MKQLRIVLAYMFWFLGVFVIGSGLKAVAWLGHQARMLYIRFVLGWVWNGIERIHPEWEDGGRRLRDGAGNVLVNR
ncbi:hypothetical protein LCGC14_2226190 [marine sediment metagenome]|uniref:Uncharacterized protein n=1 Tax=marine sediment metagenome TaxID=412755 RepID=A0A0F9DX62_9ZZZZ